MHHLNSETQLALFIEKPTMNSATNMGDNDMGTEGAGSVSRSGRVRKKNSLLAVYDSTDVVDKRKRRVNKLVKNSKMGNNIGIGGRPHLMGNKHFQHYGDDDQSLDEDGEATNNFYTNNARLKSQAESTYMMEKTYVKQRKMPGHHAGAKTKATRKDKGSPRVTAYMLWAKEQRANFTKKYPHMDFSSLSKKLSDLWATVPQNQKRMWKTKAAKIMRKNAHGAENIKNSAGPNLTLSKKSLSMLHQRKGLMKNTTPEVNYQKRPPGRPPKIPLAHPTPVAVQKQAIHTTYAYNHTSTNSNRHRPVQKNKKGFVPGNNVFANHKPAISPHTSVAQSFSPASYKFAVDCGTDTLDVAAHLSLLGESMKKLGASLQQNQGQTTNDSLSSLLDSLLCAVGPLLCLSRQVPELNCIPESQLKHILSNIDYVMPGL